MPISTMALVIGLTVGIGPRLWLGARNAAHLRRRAEADGRAMAHAVGRERAAAAGLLLDAALVVALTLGGGLAAIDATLPGGLAVVAGVAALMALTRLVPESWRRLALAPRLGLAAAPGFAGEVARRWGLGLAVMLPAGAATLWLMGVGAPWWLVLWAGWTGLELAKRTRSRSGALPRLAEGPLRARLEGLAERTESAPADIRVAEVSPRTTRANASVEGLGAAKRVVLHDTLIAALDEAAVEVVVAHELGHARLRHEEIWLAALSMARLLALWLFAWVVSRPDLAAGLGLAAGSDGARLALVGVLFVAAEPLAQPLKALLRRRLEHAADAFAARHGDPAALARALVALDAANAAPSNPDPLYAALVQGHPPTVERVRRLTAAQSRGTASVIGSAGSPDHSASEPS